MRGHAVSVVLFFSFGKENILGAGRLRLRGIFLNRIAEKVNGYLSSCVPVGRGRREKTRIF